MNAFKCRQPPKVIQQQMYNKLIQRTTIACVMTLDSRENSCRDWNCILQLHLSISALDSQFIVAAIITFLKFIISIVSRLFQVVVILLLQIALKNQ
jgi:hypothetical protein